MTRAAPLLRPLLPEEGWHEVTGWWEKVPAHIRAGERPMRSSASERDQRSDKALTRCLKREIHHSRPATPVKVRTNSRL
jgi:hypothetical protein